MYIDLLNLILTRTRKFKKHLFWGLFMEFCTVYPKWYNYDIMISLFHKNFDILHLGIFDFHLVDI